MRYLLAAALAAMGPAPAEEPEIWVFFSPDSPDGSRILAGLEGKQVRPALLSERYFGAREPAEPFLATVRAAGEIRVVDEEALRMARTLGIRALPAVAVVRGDHAHVATGTRADVKEMVECAR